MKKIYEAPALDPIEISAEKGFAASDPSKCTTVPTAAPTWT